MTDSTVARGYDTFATANFPTNEQGNKHYPKVQSSTLRTFVLMALPSIAGRTVLSATLTGRVRGTGAAQTLTVKPVSASWDAATLNWNNQPAVGAASVAVTTGALVDGTVVSWNVTSLLQGVSAGTKWFGFRLTTDAATALSFYGFKSGQVAWTLTYTLSDAPEKPTTQVPNGGIVGVTKPYVQTDFTDFGGSTEQSAIQVRIDPLGAGGGTADYDSGEVPTAEPELDLTRTDLPGGIYPGFSTVGGSTQWQTRVKDTSGEWSAWSNWATWTYQPKPTFTLDSPSGSTIGDPSPVIQGHVGSGTLANYRIRVTDGTDRTRTRYDSGKRPASGTSFTHTIPFKNSDGTQVFANGANYWLNVRVEDSYAKDREATVGDLPYVETWTLVSFTDTGTVTAPVLTGVSQPTNLPKPRLTWTRGSTPDGWVVLRDGKEFARLDPADVTNVSGTYTWDSEDMVPAFRTYTWTVKAVTTGVGQGPASNGIAATATLEGIWLVDMNGAGVEFRGTDTSDWIRQDRAAIYKTLRGGVDVVIIDAQEGLSGSYKGQLGDETGLPRATAFDRLKAFKDNPMQELWLLAADLAVKVRVRDLTYDVPDPETMPDDLLSSVFFRFGQSSGIDYGSR